MAQRIIRAAYLPNTAVAAVAGIPHLGANQVAIRKGELAARGIQIQTRIRIRWPLCRGEERKVAAAKAAEGAVIPMGKIVNFIKRNEICH